MVNVEESIVAQKMKKENSNVHIKKKKVICAVHVSTFDRSKYTRGFYRVNLKIQKLKNEKRLFRIRFWHARKKCQRKIIKSKFVSKKQKKIFKKKIFILSTIKKRRTS